MPIAGPHLDYLRSAITQRSGNVVTESQTYLLESRLHPVATSLGLADIASLVAELQRSPGSPLHDRIAEAMTINETSFFRDLQPFEALRQTILPEIIQASSSSRQLRIWSAACSSGQEPYSIAILLREHFPELKNWQVEILATDISDEMIRRTQSGVYSQFEVNRGLPARALLNYFERQGTQWQAKPEIRDLIICRKLNLTSTFIGLPKFDIIFIRNALIYFDRPAKESILTRMRQTLLPHGVLFLGGGESMMNMNVPYTRQPLGQSACYRPV